MSIIKFQQSISSYFQLHADYDFQGANNFKECRTLQSYQISEFINHCTRPSDPIILTGDFNHECHETGIRALKQLVTLQDTYDISQQKVFKTYFIT